MKVDEQVSFLKNKKSGLGVGTPARLNELINNGEAQTKLLLSGGNMYMLTFGRRLGS